jgi:uncharacterized protein (UPF0333 family)
MRLHFRAPNISQKAQAATEYMVIAAIIMATSGIVFFYALQMSQQALSAGKASEAVETIAVAIDYVYSLGYGTYTTVDIRLPGSVSSGRVGDGEVMFVLDTKGGKSDIVAPTIANATGTLPTKTGTHRVLVNYTESGVVVS